MHALFSTNLPFNLNLASAPFRTLRRGQRNFENAVAEGGFCLFSVDAFGQWYGAEEAAIATLAAVKACAILFVLLFALALNGEHVVVDVHFHIILVQPRQIGT